MDWDGSAINRNATEALELAEFYAENPPRTLAETARMARLMRELFGGEPDREQLLNRMLDSLETSTKQLASKAGTLLTAEVMAGVI